MSIKLLKFIANMAALVGPTKAHRRRIRESILGNIDRNVGLFTEAAILARAQDFTFPVDMPKAKRLMVILVPEHNDMSGGIYSMFSIANHMHALRRVHGYEVMVMTRPNAANVTYIRLSAFRNAETVYRFEQVLLCPDVEELYLHIPEYATKDFVDLLSPKLLQYLKSRKKFYVNILNQNIELMPEPAAYRKLRGLATEITQSVAHHAYFTQKLTDHYDLPTLLLPAYTDLTPYPTSTFEEKRKLIIYSKDEAPHREACLAALAKGFPDYELVEITGMTFDKFMQHATDCQFSISFGEGFDGYIAQPIHQGGIGLTTYREEFFPSEHFKQYFNIFATEDEMVRELVPRMKRLAAEPELYKSLNRAFVEEYHKLYSFEDYLDRIRRLSLRDFDLCPDHAAEMLGSAYLNPPHNARGGYALPDAKASRDAILPRAD